MLSCFLQCVRFVSFYDHLAKSTQLCYLCDVVAFDLVLDING